MNSHSTSEQQFLDKLNTFIENNLGNERYGVSELANNMGMSRSNLHRKVSKITGKTVTSLISKARLNRALILLRESSMNISDVAIESGFSSLTYFTKCFKNYYGVPPSKFMLIDETNIFPDELKYPTGKRDVKLFNTANGWIIVTLIMIVTAVFLILRPNLKLSNYYVNEKTIAVLPCNQNNQEVDNAFLCNGLINEIRYKLEIIEDLTVTPRASVERYRDTEKSINEIGKELNVNYILVGKTFNNQGRTMIEFQLYDTSNEKPFWQKPVEQEILLEKIPEIQKEMVMTILSEMKAVSTQKEKEKIDKIPTDNLAALNFYYLGIDYMNIHAYSPDKESSNQAIFKAKQSFEQAIELDSAYSDAYALLGSIYINNIYYNYSDPKEARDYLDIGLSYLDKALYYDEENMMALGYKAAYYNRIGQHENANSIWERLSKRTDSSYEYYQHEVLRFKSVQDYYAAIESYQKYLQLKPEKSIQPPYLLRSLIQIFRETGYYELEKLLAKQLFDFTRDSVEYMRNLVSSEIYQGDFNAALSYAQKVCKLDSTNGYSYWMIGLCYAWLKDFSNALNYISVSENLTNESGATVNPNYISGYIYFLNGNESQANYHFTGAIKRRQKEIEYTTPNAQLYYSHFYLANIYLALGDEKKALEYIKVLDTTGTIDFGVINILLNWPGFENIRSQQEFQEVLTKLNYMYQKQYKRIGKLTENMELNY